MFFFSNNSHIHRISTNVIIVLPKMFISGNGSDGQQRWPFLFIAIAWAYFIAPKLTIEAPVVPITSLEAKTGNAKPLGRFADVAGVVIFVLVILGFIFNKYVGQPQCH